VRLEAVRLHLARTEGLLLDPVYGYKAFAGLLSDIKNGFYQTEDNIRANARKVLGRRCWPASHAATPA